MISMFQNWEDYLNGLNSLDNILASGYPKFEMVSLGGMNIANIVHTTGKTKEADCLVRNYLKEKGLKASSPVYECRPTDDLDLLLVDSETEFYLIKQGFHPQLTGIMIDLGFGRRADILNMMTNTHLNDLFIDEYKFFRKIFEGKKMDVYAPFPGEVYADKFSLAKTNPKHAFDKMLLEKILSKSIIEKSKKVHDLY